MTNFADLPFEEIRMILSARHSTKENIQLLSFVCRQFNCAFKETFPLIVSLSRRFTTEALNSLYGNFTASPMFPTKVRRIVFSNSTSFDEQFFFN